MRVSAAQIAQVRPANTTAATAFTATIKTEVTSIIVSNTSGATAKCRIFHDDDGSTYDETTSLYWDVTVNADSTFEISAGVDGAGFTIGENGTLGVRTSVASALTFTVYGITQNIARQA